mmetsp:Transcript_57884/g.137788  ORF Transcript_57884/g.137788 Transcript_57884/m.137788 type:complete len:194 (+) Transcript_57884:97-678(+)
MVLKQFLFSGLSFGNGNLRSSSCSNDSDGMEWTSGAIYLSSGSDGGSADSNTQRMLTLRPKNAVHRSRKQRSGRRTPARLVQRSKSPCNRTTQVGFDTPHTPEAHQEQEPKRNSSKTSFVVLDAPSIRCFGTHVHPSKASSPKAGLSQLELDNLAVTEEHAEESWTSQQQEEDAEACLATPTSARPRHILLIV